MGNNSPGKSSEKTEQENEKASARSPARTKRRSQGELTNREVSKGIEINGEFDPGSGQTLAACLTHASRTEILEEACESDILVADG